MSNHTPKHPTRAHDVACSATLALALSLTTAASIATVGFREMSVFSNPDTRMIYLIALSVGLFIGVGIVCYALLRNMTRIIRWSDSKQPLTILSLTFDKRSVLIASAIILVFWIPWIILQYPCSMNGDTYNQLYQFQTSYPTYYSTIGITVDESFIDHHPVFDTLLFGAFLTFGDAIGSQNVGLFAYSLFQCILTAGMLGLCCCYLERLQVPKLFRVISLAFCAFFIPIPMWATCMIKDALYSVMFALFCLVFAEAVRTRGGSLESKRMVVAYILIACLCILTKKTGALIVAIATIVLFIFARKRWRELLLGFATPLVICFILIPVALYPAIGGVASGGKQEMFGFAFQQVITAINEDDDLSSQELESVSKVLDIERAQKKYQVNIVDPVKNSARKDATTSDYLNFIPAYFTIGARHIPAYTSSIFNVVGTLVTPGRTFTYFNTPEQTDEWKSQFIKADTKGELHLTFNKPEPIASASDAFNTLWRKGIPKLGPFQIPFNVGFYGGWIPMICIVICLFKNRKWAISLVPIIIAFGIIVIGPASSVRYALPMLYTTPLMLGILCAALRPSDKLPRAEDACAIIDSN